MIKIPKRDIENCKAFMVPKVYSHDHFAYRMLIDSDRNDNRPLLHTPTISEFVKTREFSMEKFTAYIDDVVKKHHKRFGGTYPDDQKNVLRPEEMSFININPEQATHEELYGLRTCDLEELMQIIHCGYIPTFIKKYDIWFDRNYGKPKELWDEL
jgi:hypothetical protein